VAERRRIGPSLRARLILAASSAVAIAVLLAAGASYLIVRQQLRHQVDASLRSNAENIGRFGPRIDMSQNRIRLGGVVQVLDANGNVLLPPGGVLPVTAGDRDVAEGRRADQFHDVTTQGYHLRVYTVGLVNGDGAAAAELAAPLGAVDATLKHLVLLLSLMALGGVAVAAGLGLLVARAALVPVDRLTAAAERVALTMDLSAPIDVQGVDEVARLGLALNTLLATVDQSQQAQRRLVADASHELRTPLTSLRTNLELLARSPDISDEERQSILSDLVAQSAELSDLVGQLVDLEREPLATADAPVELAFDEVVESALARARLHNATVTYEATLEPTVVVGQAGVLERAVANLLDNAAKWSPPGGKIDVNLVGGTLSVRDRGPGIDPVDVPHVFERFYRSARARALPGSGLGLSIVRQAAEDHGGQAWIVPAPGGGTVACLRIPTASPAPAPTSASADGPPPDGDRPPEERHGQPATEDRATEEWAPEPAAEPADDARHPISP
jgi:two-component system, OmpR family, sensor histidine kinase MprB